LVLLPLAHLIPLVAAILALLEVVGLVLFYLQPLHKSPEEPLCPKVRIIPDLLGRGVVGLKSGIVVVVILILEVVVGFHWILIGMVIFGLKVALQFQAIIQDGFPLL
jgi:hypothetical protein